MNDYQKEQTQAFSVVRKHLDSLPSSEREKLKEMTNDYLSFREETEAFLSEHFAALCTRECYQSRLSACCSQEGIITFFADTVINALFSRDHEIDRLLTVLGQENKGFKCVYLGEEGCLWRIKPIVCEMFLCQKAEKEVFGKNPPLGEVWERLKSRKKRYTWPDRPVLFDELETYFIEAGYSSPLMYLHNSPGLLRVKGKR